MEDKFYIEQNSYQKIIYDFIVSEEYKKVLEFTQNGNESLFKDGFIFGLCWASMMTCKAEKLDVNMLMDLINERFKSTVDILNQEVDESVTNVFEKKKESPLSDILRNPSQGEPYKVTL